MLPKSYICLSYYRGHISSIHLSATNKELHGKNFIACKILFVLTNSIWPYHQNILLKK